MADRSENLKLIISGDGKLLRAELGKDSQAITTFTQKSENSFSRLGKKINTSLTNKLKSPFTQLLGGAGLLMAGKEILDFDDKIASLQNQFSWTSAEALRARQTIIQTADDTRQSWDDVIESAMSLADKTGNQDLAINGLKGIGIAAKGTSSDMGDIANVSAALNQNLNILPGELQSAFNILAVQGDQGAFVFREMATNAERLGAAASVLNLSGLEDLKKYGAFLQMIRPSFGSADEAATSVKNIMVRIKTEAKKIKKTTMFDVFESPGKLKSFDTIIKGIVGGAKGDVVKLNDIFGESAIAFTMFNKELSDGKGFEKFDSYIQNAGSDVLWNKFLVKADTGKAKIQLFNNTIMRFAEKGLSPTINNLTAGMEGLLNDPQRIEQLAKSIETLAVAFGNLAKWLVIKPSEGWAFLLGGPTKEQNKMTILARKEFNRLPKEERKRLKPMMAGSLLVPMDWETGYYNTMKRWHPEKIKDAMKIENNITINQDSSGKVVSVTSDSLSSKVNVTSRGSFVGAQ